MKRCIKTSLTVAGLGSVLVGQLQAQTFTTLHSFTFSDGASPQAGLILSGNTLYGTTSGYAKTSGDSSGYGTVFAVNTDGTGFTNLHSFTATIGNAGIYGYGTNSDGAVPSGLILLGNTLYGTARQGGGSGNGTLFKVSTNGTGFTVLHTFTAIDPNTSTNSDGADPHGLTLSGNTLYGTASRGGSSENGTVFSVNTDGTGFTNLHSFTGSDGSSPEAELVLSSNTLYGTTAYGGSSGYGTVFAVNTDGTGFTNLHSFTATIGNAGIHGEGNNSDGASPFAGLVFSGNTLYGTAVFGGSSGNGTVFAINTNGGGFTNLHNFTYAPYPSYINSDGALPSAGLILSGNTLYGTASAGGRWGSGTVFAVNTNGTGFTNLRSFTTNSGYPYFYINSDGAGPSAGLVLSGHTLYGTAFGGGSWGEGTVFSISFTPQLTISASAGNVILTWPTNFAGFDYTGYILQSTTNLSSPVWTTNLPSPVVVNGQNTVTNPISGTRQFFRLSQ